MFVGGQGEAEQVEVLLLAVGMHGLGDDDRAVFDVPTQNHLGRADLMGGGDLLDGAAAGVEVGATRHRRVGLHGDAVLLAERHHFALLPRGMQLNLIDGRPCTGLLVQTLQIGGHEVAYAERTCHAFVAQLGGDPQGLALGTGVVSGSGERTTHAGLVVVAGRTVDVAVAGFQRGFDDGDHTLVVDA